VKVSPEKHRKKESKMNDMNLLDTALYWRQLLVKAIEEKGEDYTYPLDLSRVRSDGERDPYAYVERSDDGALLSSCIVGHALVYDGANYNKIASIEGKVARLAVPVVAPDLPSVVVAGLASAQEAQDAGQPWGEALDHYDTWCSAIPGYLTAVK
jgi:hypothetical protein